MEFDNEGLDVLLKAFCYLNEHKVDVDIVVDFDQSIISMKKHRLEECTLKIIYSKISDTKLVKEDNVLWYIEPEDVEYGIEVFDICKKNRYFSPAEFIRVKISKNKNLDYLYCKMV